MAGEMLRVLLFLLLLLPEGLCRRSKGGRYRLCPHQKLPIEESFYLVPQLQNGTRKFTNSPRRRSVRLSGRTTCPMHGKGGYSCPWYYQLNYDPDRQPSFVVEVACSCQLCQNTEHGVCRPHMVPRTVLRRRSGFTCWSWSVEGFAVACICYI